MEYGQVERWCKVHNLILNRVRCINDVTEDRCEVRGRGTRYRLEFLGRRLAEWRAYDVTACEGALAVADAVLDVVWDLRRERLASFSLG